MHIEVDEEKCVGGGQCVMAAADVFDQRDEDGIVILLQQTVADPALQASAREAAILCPAAAIRIIEQ